MGDEITKIQESLKNDSLSPGTLAEFYTKLAGWYSTHAQTLKRVELDKQAKWLEIKSYEIDIQLENIKKMVLRSKPLSDNHTDRLWGVTEEGQKEIALEWELKRIENMQRAIKQRLYIENQEAKNQY